MMILAVKIFHSYWRMGDHNRQRDFICSHVVRIEKKRNKTENSRRNYTYHYLFTVAERRVKVCKVVFLSVLNIGERTVDYCIKRKLLTGQAKADARGRHSTGIKKPGEMKEKERDHIDHFRHWNLTTPERNRL